MLQTNLCSMLETLFFIQHFDDDAREESIRTLRKYWKRAKESYWGKDKTPKWTNNGKEYNSDLPFGPWLFWSKLDWDAIDEKFDRWKNREIRNNIFNKNRNHNTSHQSDNILQSVSINQPSSTTHQQPKNLQTPINILQQHQPPPIDNHNKKSQPHSNTITLPSINFSQPQQTSAYHSFMNQHSSNQTSNNPNFSNSSSITSPNDPIDPKSPSVQFPLYWYWRLQGPVACVYPFYIFYFYIFILIHLGNSTTETFYYASVQ